jgi:hypothetical protein
MKAWTDLKRWWLVFTGGLIIGFFIGGDLTKGSIIQDCKILGMFRVGQAPISCTYHLVEVKK